MRVVVYARSSGDERDTGQDVRAQAERVRARAEADGLEVLAVEVDDGVSGTVSPFERRGFTEAFRVAQALRGGIVMAEVSRFTRAHPVVGMTYWRKVAAKGVRVRCLAQSHFDTLGVEDTEDGAPDGGTELLRLVDLWKAWDELRTTRRRTQEAMDEIKAGRRATKSGRPMGRPKKDLPREQVEEAREWIRQGMSVSAAARKLSAERGAFDAGRLDVAKKRRVGRTTLVRAIEELEKAEEDETYAEN